MLLMLSLIMLAFFKRFIYTLSNKIWSRVLGNPAAAKEKKLVVDFAKTNKSPFNIKSEDSYNAYLSDGTLTLALKKSNFIAYIDIPETEYQDHVIEAKIRLNNMGGYASTGIIFRIISDNSFYLALVSNKGYFRFDVVKDGNPRTLIAWTEVSDFDAENVNLKIITYGTFFVFLVNNKWAAEINDDAIPGGMAGFALASYETETAEITDNNETLSADKKEEVACIAHLKYFCIETKLRTIEQQFKKWNSDEKINAECRLRLAETFAVMDKPAKAMDQINKAWKQRDETTGGIAASYTEARTKKELLLAARMSFRLGQFNEALTFIDSILEQWPTTEEGKLAFMEKVKILNELDKFEDLKDFLINKSDKLEKDVDYYTMLARCHRGLKEYKQSAEAWKKAFKMNRLPNGQPGENGVYAVNAANALEQINKKEEALALYIEAGRIFLRQDNNAELEALMPKLTILGNDNWEAHALAGKWHFSIEDYGRCEKEFKAAEKIRASIDPKPPADPALYYLWGLVFYLNGKNKEAVRLLERAVKLAPDFELFKTKLAELKTK